MGECMISFRGHSAPNWVLSGLRDGSIGAICLFNYNFGSLAQLRELTHSLTAAAAEGGLPPPIIGIDQEGGQLMAVSHGATELPGNMALGATRSQDLARRTGGVLARELLAVGCNLNFAPMLDLATQPGNDGIGVRVFGSDPQLVGDLGAALISGMQEEGMLATAKHFPGLGDTPVDSHFGTPTIGASRELLMTRELRPFKAAVKAGVAAFMTCHALFPALDAAHIATHSRKILKGLLREKLGFEGLIITDALDMHGVGDMPGVERARRALTAGADLALLGHLPDQAAIVKELLPLRRGESARRVMRIREGLPAELPPLSAVGTAEHGEVARLTAERAVTAARGNPRLESGRVLLITTLAGDLTPAETASGGERALIERLRERLPGAENIQLKYGASRAEVEEAALRASRFAKSGEAEVVVATIGAAADPSQLELLNRLERLAVDPILVALRGPLDVAAAPNIKRALCTYGRGERQIEAAVQVLCGELEPQGSLPVDLPERWTGAAWEAAKTTEGSRA